MPPEHVASHPSRPRRSLLGRLSATVAALVLGGGVGVVGAGSATAAPVPPPTAFTADPCAGTTSSDPTTSGPAGTELENLLRVTGSRLDAFDAGAVVPLYDSSGFADDAAYPPLCGTRHVEGADGE